MRTHLFRELRRAVRATQREVAGEAGGGQVSRRRFVGGGLALGAGFGLAGAARFGPAPASAGGATGGAATDGSAPRIVVVGAGLAGLTAAHRLARAGYAATVYEASDRIGGRCWSNRRWPNGQVSEHGGELIDTGHTAILDLVDELGLSVENRLDATPPGTETFTFLSGQHYDAEQVRQDLLRILPQAQSDAEAAGFPILYDDFTPRARELDLMSIRDWIDAYVPGGTTSRLGQLLDVAYTIEYGATIDEQSSLNLINLFGYSTAEDPQLFGESDEVYHVAGGNDLVVQRLARGLSGSLATGTALTALARRRDGRHRLTLARGRDSMTVVADRLILALPFSLLRRVDLSRAGFPRRKRKAIDELPMGDNTKLVLGFSDRAWYEAGCDGSSYSDTGYQATWDTTLGQSGPTGILTNFTGGPVARDFASDTPANYARRFLRQLTPVLPTVPPIWTGAVSLDYWPGYRWTRGSYSYYRVGQYTTIAGVEAEPVGTCHFAGEHTSIDSQGYLNGAVESGERAAAEVLASLRSTTASAPNPA